MDPKEPKTVAEAQALPESNGMLFPSGPLTPAGFSGDTIMAFIDSDGRAMKVEHDGKQWVKIEL